MKKVGLIAVLGATIALVTAATALSGGTAVKTLQGTVGPGFTITMTQGGKAVTSVAPGTYRLTVNDRSPEHNFMLQSGKAVPQQLTTVGFTGTKTVTVTLKKGTESFFCAPHASEMRGHFGVGITAAAAAAAAPAAQSGSGSDDGDDDGGDGDD